MIYKRITTLTSIILISYLAATALATDGQRRLTYQGRVTGVPPSEVRAILVRIYDTASGAGTSGLVWGDSIGERHEVTVESDGTFAIVIGVTDLDVRNAAGQVGADLVPDLDQIDASRPLYLDIRVEREGTASPIELRPRQRIYPAFHAATADLLTKRIQNDQIGPDAIRSDNILNETIRGMDLIKQPTPGLACDAITGDRICDRTITGDDIALAPTPNPTPGATPGACSAVSGANICDGTVSLADLTQALRDSLVPVGTIISSMLPPAKMAELHGVNTWVLADGRSVVGSAYASLITNNVPDLGGAFLRGLNTATGHLDPDGARVAGSFQSDAFQGHTFTDPAVPGSRLRMHITRNQPDASASGFSNMPLTGMWGNNPNFNAIYGTPRVASLVTDGVTRGGVPNGAARIENETRPSNFAVYYYVRIN